MLKLISYIFTSIIGFLRKKVRTEEEVFLELSKLCKSAGYIHALAFINFRDNTITMDEAGIVSGDFDYMYSHDRLIRTELTTLFGLIVQGEIDFTIPKKSVLRKYIKHTDRLMKELHEVLLRPMIEEMGAIGKPEFNLLSGATLREAIFYGPESAYLFQYREFSSKRYENDSDWLNNQKGFTIADVRVLSLAISKSQTAQISTVLSKIHEDNPFEHTLLPMFILNVNELVESTGLDKKIILSILTSFSIAGKNNPQFNCLSDFNQAYAQPILRISDDEFLLFHVYGLVEAAYDTPFYWMLNTDYANTASDNRGLFTENFCKEKLERVFGKENVFQGAEFKNNRGEVVGEIDVLVVFGDRAIVLQAKAKRLTLESRKGNDFRIKEDFKKSVQESYDQGLDCSKLLINKSLNLYRNDGVKIELPSEVNEVFILTVVSDHYPSLSYQVSEFLKYESDEHINPPFVLDVFTLDVIVEMLDSPLYFLSYIKRRTNYFNRVSSSHELAILAFHLKTNLWINSENEVIFLSDDIATDLDIAMMVRRDGIYGEEIPAGILTKFRGTTVAKFLKQIEHAPHSELTNLGFLILTLSEEALFKINDFVDMTVKATMHDKKQHDCVMSLGESSSGITFMTSYEVNEEVLRRFRIQVDIRKYLQEAKQWFGVVVDPDSKKVLAVYENKQSWISNEKMDSIINMSGLRKVTR